MSATSQVTITGVKAGLPGGSQSIGPLSITNSASGDYVQDLVSVNGNNTIAVPTWAVGVVIIPPSGNTTAWTLKGITGDTGVSIHLTNPFVWSFPATQTTFVLNIGASNLTFTLIWL